MATQHKEIDAQTLENLLYLSRLSPESTNMETLKKQVDEIVGYFDILSKYDDSENPYDAYPSTEAEKLREDTIVQGLEMSDVKKINAEHEQLTDDELEKVAGGTWAQTGNDRKFFTKLECIADRRSKRR